MNLDGQCIDGGGIWCTLDTAMNDGTSKVLLLAFLFAAVVLAGATARGAAKRLGALRKVKSE